MHQCQCCETVYTMLWTFGYSLSAKHFSVKLNVGSDGVQCETY